MPQNSSNDLRLLQGLATTPAGLAYLASNGRWKYARHLQLLNTKLLDVAAGRTRRLMVFMPPRHGKSQLISETFPAWYLGTHPEHRVILGSYGAELAAQFGRKARDILDSFGPSLYGIGVSPTSSAANRWDVHRHRGGAFTVGVGGPMTGMGAQILICDDPVKNWEDAQSQTIRDNIYDWYRSTAYTRLTPNGAVILVMTRWHHDDLAGRLLKDMEHGGDKWDVVSLPALAEGEDEMGRKPGEALWPEQFSAEKLTEIKAAVGGQVWISLYQQRPSPVSGAVFKRAWTEKRYRELPQLTQTAMAVDAAFKTGVSNDYSAIAVFGRDQANYYALSMWHERLEYPDLKRAIIDQFNRYRPQVVLIEDAASGQSVIQDLRRTTALPIVPVAAKGSKESRADVVSPLFEAGKVWLPEGASWLEDFISELTSFPVAPHDDQVDAAVHALMRLSNRGQVGSIPSILDTAEEALPTRNIWDPEPAMDVAIWE